MRRRIDVRGVVHAGRDALGEHTRLRHVVDAFDLDVFEIRPVGRLIAEAMGQVIELESHAVVVVLFEHHAANFFCHGTFLPNATDAACGRLLPFPSLSQNMVRLYRNTVTRATPACVRRRRPPDALPGPFWWRAAAPRSAPYALRSAGSAPAPRWRRNSRWDRAAPRRRHKCPAYAPRGHKRRRSC